MRQKGRRGHSRHCLSIELRKSYVWLWPRGAALHVARNFWLSTFFTFTLVQRGRGAASTVAWSNVLQLQVIDRQILSFQATTTSELEGAKSELTCSIEILSLNKNGRDFGVAFDWHVHWVKAEPSRLTGTSCRVKLIAVGFSNSRNQEHMTEITICKRKSLKVGESRIAQILTTTSARLLQHEFRLVEF